VPDPFAADLEACRATLRDGSRSFLAATRLLPARVHRPATALYAFCRVADDLIDADPQSSTAALALLHRRLDAIYANRPMPEPADRALCHVVVRHRMPRALLDALLEGFSWDVEGRRYEDIAALEEYAARVAGAVGAMMAVLMGARLPDSIARACDLGIAMQLSNIARDVGEDARAGRMYLPLRWLRDAGIDPDAFLAAPAPSLELAEVIRRLLAHAETLYRRADRGIAALPIPCRPGIGAARRLYAAIGREVALRGHDSITSRAQISAGRKLGLIGLSLLAAPFPRATSHAAAIPPLPAARFLIAAVSSVAVPAPAPIVGWRERVLWVATLFSQLDHRQARN
jgi:15-cis-phytoene synthase